MNKDSISRQAAIDAMRQYAHYDDFDISVVDEDVAVIALKDLPSVQERKGRWVEHKDYPGLAYSCSECNHFTTIKSNYCPDCGIHMEGVKE